MYVNPNFKTKKEFKEAVKKGEEVKVFSPGPFPPTLNGREFIEGPHYPEPHKWYAVAQVVEGKVVKVEG